MSPGADETLESMDELEALVLRAQSGSEVAVHEICRRFTPLVYRQAGQGYAKAYYEDAVSEGWAGVLTAIREFDPRMGVRFPGFAESKVRSFIWTYCRREWQTDARYPVLEDIVLNSAADIHVQVEQEALFRVMLQKIAGRITDRQQYAFQRVILEGLTLKEAGSELGISVQAVYRSIKHVKKILKNEYGETL